jgi:hypothetical protein
MMIKVTVFALAAAAAAQSPQVSSSPNGDLRVTRQQEVDVGQVADTVASLESRMDAMSATPTSFMETLMQEVVTTNRDLAQRITAMETLQNAAQSNMAALSTSVGNQLAAASTATASANAAQTATISRTASTLTASVSTSIAESASIATASANALDTRMTGALSNMTRNMATFQPKTYMWTGGCSESAYPRGNGWREYCLDQVHVDTSMPKFRVETNRGAYQGFNSQEGVDGKPSRFRALVAGNYWINVFYISRSHNWAYTLIYINNRYRVHGNHRTWRWHDWGEQWKDIHANLAWPVEQNQMFWARMYAHPGHWTVYHRTNSNGAHSRMTVAYQGELRGSI